MSNEDSTIKSLEKDIKKLETPKASKDNTSKQEEKDSGSQNKPAEKKTPKKRNYQRRRRTNVPKKDDFKKISVVIPLYNEEESLEPLYAEVKKAVKPLPQDHEIIFVDDGSRDNSLNIIKRLAGKDPKIKYVSFRTNFGKSAALQIGFDRVQGDVTITMDADLQDDPAEIPNLIAKLKEGYDLVSGWKKMRHDPFIKKHTSKFFNFITTMASGIKLHDFNCGLKAYRSEVVKSVHIYGELHRFIPVLAGNLGFRITELAVRHHPRRFGVTKFGISRFFKGFIDLITVIFTTRYIKRPMHLFGFLGFLAFFVGTIVNLYLSYTWIFLGHSLSNRPLLLLGMLLMIVGVQFFSTGLIGEFLVHKFKDETEYSIKEQK